MSVTAAMDHPDDANTHDDTEDWGHCHMCGLETGFVWFPLGLWTCPDCYAWYCSSS